MNKGKLRSLMFHAGFCNEDGGWDDRPIHEQEHDNFQRFVELIVRECYDISLKAGHPVSEIKKHFGVNE